MELDIADWSKSVHKGDLEEALEEPLELYSIYDIEYEGEDKLALVFNSRQSIVLYQAFESAYANKILNKLEKPRFGTTLFESAGYAKAHTIKRAVLAQSVENTSVLQFDVDISRCLDLLSIEHIKILQEFYKFAMDNKIITRDMLKDRDNIDSLVIEQFYLYNKRNNRLNFNTIRKFNSKGKQIYTKSEFKETSYVGYTILDNSCIKCITKPSNKTKA